MGSTLNSFMIGMFFPLFTYLYHLQTTNISKGKLELGKGFIKMKLKPLLKAEWDSSFAQCPVKFQNRERGIEFCRSRKIIKLIFI